MVIVPGWEVDRGAGRGTHFNDEATRESEEEAPSGVGCMLARFLATEPICVCETMDLWWYSKLTRKDERCCWLEAVGQTSINSHFGKFRMTHTRRSEIHGARNCYTSSQLQVCHVDSQS